ncbi:AAA family ATPase [Helicovermis profundi]|uniref:Nuclease SbcCD subunit C n=1 Tax=Helicovermis profundi TaxID=3065157 RepID=A0AAU9E1A0_9FIRM|nr:AAA family ATPase [Clostridia bacterium S502]
MKPIFLKLAGLNSYIEEESVDFEKLSSRGLFGIFGTTGSGKSTILDAITISLFGTNAIARSTKEFINTDVSHMKLYFKFELNTSSGRCIFEINRSFKRSKSGVINDMARFTKKSINGELIEIREGASDVNEIVVSEIGLKPDDFMKSVVLPQGKFSDFLNMSGKDKRNMLERLLNLGEFGSELSNKVRLKKNKLTKELDVLKGQLSVFNIEEFEKLDQYTLKNAQLKKEEESLQTLIEKLEKEKLEKKELFKKREEFNKVSETLSKLSLEKKDMEVKKDLVLKYEEAIKIYPYKKDLDKLNEDIISVKKSLENKSKEKEKILKSYNENKIKFENIENEKNTELPKLDIEIEKLKENIILEKRTNELEIEIKNLRENYSKINKKREELSIEYEKLNKELFENKSKKESINISKEENYVSSEFRVFINKLYELKTEKLKLENLNKNIIEKEEYSSKALQELEKNLSESGKNLDKMALELENNIKEEIEIKDNIENIKIEISKINEDIVKINSKIPYIKERLENKDLLVKEIKDFKNKKVLGNERLLSYEKEKEILLDKIKMYEEDVNRVRVNNVLEVLSHKLTENNECPLCGNIHHPKVFKKKEDNGIDYKDKLDSLNKELIKLTTKITRLELENESFEKSVAKANHNLKAFEDIDSKVYTKITQDKELKEKVLNSKNEILKNSLKEQAIVEKKIENNRLDKEKYIIENNSFIENRKQLIEVLKETVKDKENNIKLTSDIDKNIDLIFDKNILEYDQKRCVNIFNEIINEKNTIEKKDKFYQKNDKELINIDKLIALNISKIETLKEEINQKTNEIDVAIEKGKGISEIIKINKEKLNKYSYNDSLEKVLKNAINKKTRISEEYNELKQKTENEKELILKTQNVISSLEGNLDIYNEKSVEVKSRLLDLVNKSIFESDNEIEKYLVSEKRVENLKIEIENFENEFRTINQNFLELSKIISGKAEKDFDYISTQNLLESSKKEKEEKIGEMGKISSIIDSINKDKESYIVISNLEKEKNRKYDLVMEIQKLLHGNKFVEYIATKHMKYIVKDASIRLLNITNDRYSLEIDSKGNFIICDNYNGGVKRSTSTLSGGETFMTSLSLALALSSQIQLKGNVNLEFFILDEGFGSLDKDLLDTVMSSLEKLHSDNLSIGIISHVEELKTRVPIALLVNEAAAGIKGSSLQIKIN